jgi:hypothetical protein
MPHKACVYCSKHINNTVKGRKASTKQYNDALDYHGVRKMEEHYICEYCRRWPPTQVYLAYTYNLYVMLCYTLRCNYTTII